MTIHRSRRVWLTDQQFSEAMGEFFSLLRDSIPGGILEYLLVNEWVHGVRHAHALVIAPGGIPRGAVKTVIDNTDLPLRCTCEPLRKDPPAAVRYVFKDMNSKKAELPPPSFHGRVFTYSRGFLVRPLKELWREFRESKSVVGGAQLH